jgi:hypothetical protein
MSLAKSTIILKSIALRVGRAGGMQRSPELGFGVFFEECFKSMSCTRRFQLLIGRDCMRRPDARLIILAVNNNK